MRRLIRASSVGVEGFLAGLYVADECGVTHPLARVLNLFLFLIRERRTVEHWAILSLPLGWPRAGTLTGSGVGVGRFSRLPVMFFVRFLVHVFVRHLDSSKASLITMHPT